MVIIAILLSLPILYLAVRILLIFRQDFWVETDCEIISFNIVKKRHTELFPNDMGDAPNNYALVKYRYNVDGKEKISEKISLDLLDRAYRPIEIQHDPFLNEIRKGCLKCYYLRFWPSLSVLSNRQIYAGSNFVLLLLYIVVLLSSYMIIVYIS